MLITRLFNNQFQASLSEIRFFTFILSLLLSAWAFYLDDLINSDGVLYLNMVRAFLDGGFSAMAEIYDWPFFAVLIALFHQLTGLSIELSGNILNTVFFAIFTDSLILLCHKRLPNNRQLLIAALFILGFTYFNDYRAYLFRDLGYWAFMGLSLYGFICFLEKPSWFNAVRWQGFIFVSILFRVEGIVIFALLPLFLLSTTANYKEAMKQMLKLWSGALVLGGSCFIVILGTASLSDAFGKLHDVVRYINIVPIFERFQHNSEIINTQIMSVFDKESGSLILSTGLLAIVLDRVITALGIAYLLFYLISHRSRYAVAMPKAPYSRLLRFFIFINLLILITFVFTSYFLSTRYAFMLITALFLLMLPRFCQFSETLLLKRHKGLLFLTALIILAGPIDSLTRSVTKGYIKDTALWAAAELPANSRTLTLDTTTDFYIRENDGKTDVQLNVNADPYSETGYDYLIVIIRARNNEEVGKLLEHGFTTIFEAKNSRGDAAKVMKFPASLRHPASQ